MDRIQRICFRQLFGGAGGEIAYELTNVQFTPYSAPEAWHPALNAYRCEKGFALCVDLAGVEKGQIDVRVEPRRVRLRGHRQAPEPGAAGERTVQVLIMEIDYGPFDRTVTLPAEVEPERVTAEQRNGFLWIHLPLRSPWPTDQPRDRLP